MTIKLFRKIYIQDDENLNRVQDNIAATISSLVNEPIINTVTITALINATNTTIKHNLGRTPIGYIIIGKNVTADVWDISLAREEIVLIASAPVTIKFYLF